MELCIMNVKRTDRISVPFLQSSQFINDHSLLSHDLAKQSNI